MRQSRAIGRVLLAAVTDHDWRRPPPGIDNLVAGADLSGLPRAAAFHGVTGCVYHSVGHSHGLDTAVADALRATHHRAMLTHLRVLDDLRQIAPAIDALGVPWLVLKGPVLAEAVYPRPDLRGYTDLDLVVPGIWLGRVLDAMEDIGSRVLDPDWFVRERHLPGQVHLVTRQGTLVDLHWHLLNEGHVRDAFTVPMEQVFDRARMVSVGGTNVPALDPADALIHLSLHTCLSGADRLVWLKDVEQSIICDGPSWETVAERSRAFGAALTVASVLHLARTVLGASVPSDVVRSVGRGGTQVWPSLFVTAGRLSPVERASGGRSPLRLVAKATRSDLRASAMTLAGHTAAALCPPVSHLSRRRTGDRVEYLQAVAQYERRH